MLEELKRQGELYQETVVYEIAEKFGEQFTCDNKNGKQAIGKDVLAAFRKLTKNSVVWEKENRCWRKRESGDEPGRISRIRRSVVGNRWLCWAWLARFCSTACSTTLRSGNRRSH